MRLSIDLSPRGKGRVYLLTLLGTCFCIAFAYLIDGLSGETEAWSWDDKSINNLVIPLLLAPPFFYLLLSKMRELSIAHHELSTLASTDVLTSCLNRRAFTAIVEGYLDRFGEQAQGALLVVDIDHFKMVNDTYGHDKGDIALRLVADTLRDNVREIDLVGRMGGEEFGVFMPGLNFEATSFVAERLRLAVTAVSFIPQAHAHPLSISVGGTAFDGATTFETLYRHADERLFTAKRAGRNRADVIPLAEAA